jgi:hypothetical protein
MASSDNFNTVTVTNVATLVMAANVDRHSYLVGNASAVTVYLGPTSSVTSATGVPLEEDGTLAEDNSGTKLYTGDIYAITAAGAADIRFWERIRGAS